jgi:hypothetical protein
VVPLIAAFILGDLHSALLVASLVTGTYALCIVALRGRQFWQTSAFRLRSGQVMLATGVLSVTLFLLNAFSSFQSGFTHLLCASSSPPRRLAFTA